MPYDFTTVPTTTELADLLGSIGLSALATSVDADLQDAYIGAAVASIEKATKRQFVAGSAGEIRYYDGSGTGQLEIDEYIDITAVEFVTFPTATEVSVTQYVEVEDQGVPKTRLQIYRGQPNFTTTYYPEFPEGRRNIKVTGQFGYGSSIPKDVWLAMLYQAGSFIVDSNLIKSGGGLPMVSWQNADREERYDVSGSITVRAGWKEQIDHTIARYRRPTGTRRRRNSSELF